MFSIGKFSKLTGVSKKTLIWYDNIGLLKPEYVNEENGYRYYDTDSVKKLANIQYLQSLDFSINEIMNLTEKVISYKIQCLNNKIEYIKTNIPLLENLMEGNMKKKILSIYDVQKSYQHQSRIQGKWIYAMSTNNFAEAILPCPIKTKSKDMPGELFFGEKQSGTDTENHLYYTIDQVRMKDKVFNFLIMNLDDNLILFERKEPYADEAKEQELYFHVYQRLNRIPYTQKDMELIKNKAEYRKPKMNIKSCEHDGHLDGTWKHIDNIKGSEIKNYKEREKKDVFNILFPMYDKITFNKNEVSVMPAEQNLTVGKKVYSKENSMMKLYVCTKETFIENSILNVRHNIVERNVDGQVYLFINFTNDLDIDEETLIFVYKKIYD